MVPSLRKTLVTCAAATLASTLMWTTSAPPPASATPGRGEHPADHVVLLALDGFDVEYLDLVRSGQAPMPNLERLVRRGSLATSTGVMTSITNPSWSSVATGAWPATHRNTA